MDYPKWLYGPNGESKLVNNETEEKALGKGWEIHPDKAKAKQIEKVNDIRDEAEQKQKEAADEAEVDRQKAEAKVSKESEAASKGKSRSA